MHGAVLPPTIAIVAKINGLLVVNYTCRLYELRSNGITTYNGGRIFQKLRAQRTSRIRTKSTMAYEWKHLMPDENQQLSGAGQIMKHCLDLHNLPVKRKSTPLNIIGSPKFRLHIRLRSMTHLFYSFVGLPNYDKLNEDERQLCSNIRIIPDAYFAYKKNLTAENAKIGYLRLADARRLVKIDVNKTRVLYDFLLDHGFINKPFSN